MTDEYSVLEVRKGLVNFDGLDRVQFNKPAGPQLGHAVVDFAPSLRRQTETVILGLPARRPGSVA